MNPTNKYGQTPIDLAFLQDPSDDRLAVLQQFRTRGCNVSRHVLQSHNFTPEETRLQELLETPILSELSPRFEFSWNQCESFVRGLENVNPGVWDADDEFRKRVDAIPRNVVEKYLVALEFSLENQEKFLEKTFGSSTHTIQRTILSEAFSCFGYSRCELLRQWLERECAVHSIEQYEKALKSNGKRHPGWSDGLRDVDLWENDEKLSIQERGDRWDSEIIRLYTSESRGPKFYNCINRHLNEQLTTSLLYPAAKVLSYALWRKSTACPELNCQEITLYRALTLDKDNFECYVNRSCMNESSRVIMWKGFTSTTWNLDIAANWNANTLIEIDVKVPSYWYRRPAFSGFRFVNIAKFSAQPHECEVLIQAGTPFVIKEARRIYDQEFGPNIKQLIRLEVRYNPIDEHTVYKTRDMSTYDMLNPTQYERGVWQFSLGHSKESWSGEFQLVHYADEFKMEKSAVGKVFLFQQEENSSTGISNQSYLNEFVTYVEGSNTKEKSRDEDKGNAIRLLDTPLAQRSEINGFDLIACDGLYEQSRRSPIASNLDGEMIFRFHFKDTKRINLRTVSLVFPKERAVQPTIAKFFPFKNNPNYAYEINFPNVMDEIPALEVEREVLEEDEKDDTAWFQNDCPYVRWNIEIMDSIRVYGGKRNAFQSMQGLTMYVSSDCEDAECHLLKVEFYGDCLGEEERQKKWTSKSVFPQNPI